MRVTRGLQWSLMVRRPSGARGRPVEAGQAHPDEVGGRVGDGAVDAEDGELNLLPGLHIAAHYQAVRRVPTSDDGAAALAEGASQFAIHPNFGVVVERSFEDHGGAGG